jgi:ATP-binding cassette subfamily C (CFTR/MRP) protein 4
MDISRPPNAYTTASFFSKVFFTWPYPLLKLGMQQTLQEIQLPHNANDDTSQYALQQFHRIWNPESCARDSSHHHSTTRKSSSPTSSQRRPNRSLRYAIAKDYFTSLWYIQPLMALGATAKVIQAYTLGKLIHYFAQDKEETTVSSSSSIASSYPSSSYDGYMYASIIVLCGIIVLLEHHHLFFYTWKKGMQLRIACIAAIYEKCTKLSSISISTFTNHTTTSPSKVNNTPTTTSATSTSTSSSHGQVMNLISNDVERFLLAALFVNYIFWGPIISIAIVIVGYTLMGYSFVIGIVVLFVLFIPLQIYFSHRFAHYRNQIAQYTDQRVLQIGQAIRGVRMMKLLGYETHFQSTIQQYRKQEIQHIGQANRLKAYNEAFIFMTNIIVSVIIFIIHVTVFHQP